MRWLALIERAERSAVTPGAGVSTVEKLAEHEADAERGEQAGQRSVLDLALERADRVPGLAARLLGGTPDPLAPLARGIAPQVLQGIGNSGQVRAQRFDLGFQLLDVFVGTRAHVRPPSNRLPGTQSITRARESELNAPWRATPGAHHHGTAMI